MYLLNLHRNIIHLSNCRLQRSDSNEYYHERPKLSKVLIFCVEFWELSHLKRDLSQAEKKINLLKAEQMHKMTSISLKIVKLVILNENRCHFVTCSACNNSYFLLCLR